MVQRREARSIGADQLYFMSVNNNLIEQSGFSAERRALLKGFHNLILDLVNCGVKLVDCLQMVRSVADSPVDFLKNGINEHHGAISEDDENQKSHDYHDHRLDFDSLIPKPEVPHEENRAD